MERLVRSCNYLEIPLDMTVDDLIVGHADLVLANRPKEEFRTMVNISRGLLPMYRRVGKLGTNVMMTCFPLKWVIGGNYKYYRDGVKTIIPRQMTIPARFMEPKIKNRSRIHYKMADIEAHRQDPEAWALLLDDDGFIAEGSGSNFFLVKDRVLLTPEPRNILRGITRKSVMKLARKLKVEVAERNIEPYDAYNADEAFFTNTPYAIVPVVEIDGHKIGDGKPGKLTRHLSHKFGEDVGVDFRDQLRRWDSG